MPAATAYYLSATCLFLIWGYLLVQGLRSERGRAYPAFYVFVALSAASHAAKLIGVNVLGKFTYGYSYLYYLSSFPVYLAEVWILWRILQVSRGRSSWSILLGVGVFGSVMLAGSLAGSEVHVFLRLENVALSVLSALGATALVAAFQSRRVAIGRNYAGMLLGILLPACLMWANQTAYLFGAGWWPFPLFDYSIEPLYLLSWFVLLWAMRTFDPPVLTPGVPILESVIRRRLQKAFLSLKGLAQ